MSRPVRRARGRPLLISDCDEVILHFLAHFAEWVDEAAGLHFAIDAPNFSGALTTKAGQTVPAERVWPLLDLFFDSEMHRQNVVPGAAEALRAIGEVADIVILTNIGDQYQAGRAAQLAAFDIHHRVLCNHGGKGPPVAELIAEMAPGPVVFVDDLAVHHESVATHAPKVGRLHMIAEPRLAARMPAAPHAHARIDDWNEALPWILARLEGKSE
jgi:hypothetical protein